MSLRDNSSDLMYALFIVDAELPGGAEPLDWSEINDTEVSAWLEVARTEGLFRNLVFVLLVDSPRRLAFMSLRQKSVLNRAVLLYVSPDCAEVSVFSQDEPEIFSGSRM